MAEDSKKGRRSKARKYLPDVVYGANDGLVTTFAIVAGTVGARLSTEVVLILGFASLLADGFSMGASDYLSERSSVEEGGERPGRGEAAKHGLATLVAFVVVGVVPLVGYLLPVGQMNRFWLAAGMTLVTLFAVGAARSLVAELRWFRSGLEMLGVGATAAAVAYGIGALLSSLTGGQATGVG